MASWCDSPEPYDRQESYVQEVGIENVQPDWNAMREAAIQRGRTLSRVNEGRSSVAHEGYALGDPKRYGPGGSW